jgi:alkanesulfonate monooxygenase SsuD/methylene tetrahydromethanopterin reductase-like flavin-dependent oxidoreductase (luciferase family)
VLVEEGARSQQGQIVGAPEQVAERLASFVRHGFTFLNLWPDGDMTAQLERLAKEVVPAIRALADR